MIKESGDTVYKPYVDPGQDSKTIWAHMKQNLDPISYLLNVRPSSQSYQSSPISLSRGISLHATYGEKNETLSELITLQSLKDVGVFLWDLFSMKSRWMAGFWKNH